jgi:cardiolipin synthase
VAFTGGYNLADEYFNVKSPYGHWKDTGVMITGDAVVSFTVMFLEMWNAVKKDDRDYSRYIVRQKQPVSGDGYVQPYADSPLDEERVGENVYLNMLKTAREYAWITTPYLIPDYNLICALRDASLRGVRVEIITPHVPDKRIVFSITRANYRTLLEAGVHIFEYTPGFVHAKTLLCDGEVALVGTLNLDYRSLVHHSECGAIFAGCSAVRDAEEDFEKTRLVSQEIPADFKPSPIAKLTNLILAPFTPLF